MLLRDVDQANWRRWMSSNRPHGIGRNSLYPPWWPNLSLPRVVDLERTHLPVVLLLERPPSRVSAVVLSSPLSFSLVVPSSGSLSWRSFACGISAQKNWSLGLGDSRYGSLIGVFELSYSRRISRISVRFYLSVRAYYNLFFWSTFLWTKFKKRE